MGSSKPHPRGKPQRRDKVKPAVQHGFPARSLAVSAQPATPDQPAPHAQPRNETPIAQKPEAARSALPKPGGIPATHAAPPAKAPPEDAVALPTPLPATPAPAPAMPIPAAAPPATAHGAHGASEPIPGRHITQRTPTPASELTPMFEELRQLFAQDRAYGARADAARCGICYLTYPRDELIYREQDGFYACPACARGLGPQRLP
nr:hypothetical protein [Ktedonobacterales bacterium]